MNVFTRSLVLSIAALLWVAWVPSANAADAQSAAGLWKTIDDKDNQPRSLVRIVDENGELKGKVEKIFPRPEDQGKNICEKCTGDRKDKPVVGMEILWGLTKNGAEYTGGEILDPNNGKIYKCKMKVVEDGKKLNVRGYIGVSLLGRTQTWLREE